MKPVELSVVINRPLEECFAYLTDLANDLEWRRAWIQAEKTTDGPHGVGAWYRLSGPLPLTFSRAFKGVRGGTRVTMRYEGAHGLLRLVGPLVAGIGRRQLEGDFPRLKQVMESVAS